MPYQLSNGIRIYYEIHGKGEPLILISGLGGDRTFWQPHVETLSFQYKLIVFDTRGIGLTDAPREPYNLEMFADDLAGLMQGLGINHAHLLGFSMGGNIALQFALKYPAMVNKLIIAASCARLNTQIKLYVDAVLEVYEGGISPAQMFKLIAPWLFSNTFLGKPGNEAYLQFDENDPSLQPLYAWKNQYEAQRLFDCSHRLHEIRHQTLIITGEQDVFAQLADAEILAEGIPDANLLIISAAGHLFNYEQPELFHRYVQEFLL